jgi:hypothetical protein
VKAANRPHGRALWFGGCDLGAAAKDGGGQAPQFVVDQRQDSIQCFPISFAPVQEKSCFE